MGQTQDVADLITQRDVGEVKPFGNEKGDEYPPGIWAGHSKALTELLSESGLTQKKWKSYVLRGTQVDFTDKFGRSTILSNSVIEEGFQQTSSCITCHAKAGIGPRKRRNDEPSRLPVFAKNDPPVGDIGSPKSKWFFSDATSPPSKNYLQLDFVWSTIRAKRRTLSHPGAGESSTESSAFLSSASNQLLGKWTYSALGIDSKEVSADSEMANKFMGTGVLEIKNFKDGKFDGVFRINDSSTDHRWNLTVHGTAKLDASQWKLEFEGMGSSLENDRNSKNFWHYGYKAYSVELDGATPVLQGTVTRLKDHLSADGKKIHPKGQQGLTVFIKQN